MLPCLGTLAGLVVTREPREHDGAGGGMTTLLVDAPLQIRRDFMGRCMSHDNSPSE